MNKSIFGLSKNRVNFIVLTAIMLSLTIVLQYLSSLASQQLLTGSVVNMMLLLSISICGILGASLISLITPFIGLLIGMSQNIVMVPFIALGNLIYVVSFFFLKKLLIRKETKLDIIFIVISLIVAAALKYLFMYFVLYKVIINLVLGLNNKVLALSFGLTQLFTALIGGAVAIIIDRILSRIKVFSK